MISRRKLVASSALMTAGLLLVARGAQAQSLEEARRAGTVGERFDGYVAAVQDSAAARSLASSINDRRRAYYQEVARNTSTPLADVERVAGARLIAESPSGSYVDRGAGWERK